MTAEEVLKRVRADDLARLRWHLCRMFRVAPWSRLARSLTNEDCLLFAAHMLLDRRDEATPTAAENPGFDGELFRIRKGGRI